MSVQDTRATCLGGLRIAKTFEHASPEWPKLPTTISCHDFRDSWANLEVEKQNVVTGARQDTEHSHTVPKKHIKVRRTRTYTELG